MFNKRERDFRDALKDTFNTPSGRKVLAYLKIEYVDATSFDPNSALNTAGMTCRKEFVQMLINLVREEELHIEEQRIIKVMNEENYNV